MGTIVVCFDVRSYPSIKHVTSMYLSVTWVSNVNYMYMYWGPSMLQPSVKDHLDKTTRFAPKVQFCVTINSLELF